MSREAAMMLMDELQKTIRPLAENLLRLVLANGDGVAIQLVEELIGAIDRASDIAMRGEIR